MKKIASIGLYGSIAAAVLTITFHYAPYRFYQSPQVSRWLLVTGAVLGILTIAAVLLTIRKTIPTLRQSEQPLDQRVKNYSDLIRRINFSALTVNIILCAFVVLSGDATLLMIVMLMVLMLILTFPNMYKVKHDLGLNDDQMVQLYGDQYVK